MTVFLLSHWKGLCRATGRGYAHQCSLSVSWCPRPRSLHIRAGREAPGSGHKEEDLQPVKRAARQLSRLT